ncbi:MAG: hypothetical protein EZS28_007667 [Streblomastix strix]|uniref:Uncharacterized protein n=1 Tax=Streblomastix strix TaxID=222440 RepID=A0A5J4WQZ3_9EUKA|nr:MAG: hypothetical protein EZS28_007667 [Streblomastix strix]
MNKDNSNSQTQRPDTPTQKTTHRGGVKQRQKKLERELQKLQASQQLEQQKNNDFNIMNIDIPDIQGTIGQLTGLQPSSGAQSASLNAGLRLKETGSISASNWERTDPQINKGQEDNTEEEENELTDGAALIQNQNYRVNVVSQLQVQENLGTQPQNNLGLNALSQMDKDNSGPAPVGVQEKFKKRKASRKTKIERLSATNEPCKGSNAQTQTQIASTVPKPKVTPKKKVEKKPNKLDLFQKILMMRMKWSRAPDRPGILQLWKISVEISLWNREKERTDEDGFTGDGGKDWKISAQRKEEVNRGEQKDLYMHKN